MNYLETENKDSFLHKAGWAGLLLLILASSFLFSLVLLASIHSGWEVSRYYSQNAFDFFISTFPFIAFLASFFFLILSMLIFVLSDLKGKLPLYNAIFAIVISSLLFSLFFYYSNISKMADDHFSRYDYYALFMGNRNKVWEAPEHGLLSGQIGIINDKYDFLLVDFKGQTWHISSKDPIIKDKSIIKTGNMIKLIGKPSQDTTFEAKEIRAY